MLPTYLPTFAVIHSGVHSRCKNSFKKSDRRIQSYESLNLISEPLQIYCHHCQEEFTSSTIDVWMYVNLSIKELFYEVAIDQVLNQHDTLEAEYNRGMSIMRKC